MKKSIGFLGILMIFLVSLVFSVHAVLTVTISPLNPVTTNDLVVSCGVSCEGYTINWYKNNDHMDDYDNESTIPFSATAKGEKWNASVDSVDSDLVIIQNSAPVLSLENLEDKDKKAHEDLLFTLDCEDYATDADGDDTLSYFLKIINAPSGSTFTLANFDNHTTAGTGKITWTPKEEDIGELELEITVIDDEDLTKSGTFIIDVYPDFMCKEGEGKTGLDIKIKEPDNGDDFTPGDRINLEVEVDNDAKDMDVVVEAFLYNIDQNDEVDGVESDAVDIDKGDSPYDFDEDDGLFLVIPYDLEFDSGDEFRIYVKAYEDGEEDEYCISDSIEIEIEREDDAVIIEKAKLTPSVVEPGEVTELVVNVLNIGDKDQDDVTIRVVRSDLKIDLTSTRFDLDEFDDSDNDATKRFTLNIPTTAKPGEYSIEVSVLDEDEDVYDVDMATEFVTLTVAGEAVSEEEASLELIKTSFEQNKGDSFSLPVKVKNTGASEATFIVEVFPVGGWADTATEIISVGAGKETIVYPALTIRSSVSEGSYTAQVSLKSQDGSTLDSGSVSITVKSEGITGVTSGVTYMPTSKWFSKDILTNVFWIIGNLALVIIVIYFVKLIFIKPR